MDRFDFSPLFRSTIGFDRLTRLVDAATRVDGAALAYPPYNIEKTGEDAYRLTMAVAGFSPDEIDVTAQENSLLVTGKAKRTKTRTAVTCTAASPGARSSGASASPTTSRSSVRASSTACCMSTSSTRCPRR